MLKVVLTSFFFFFFFFFCITLAELAQDTNLLLRQHVFCTYTLFGTLNFTTIMAELLSRWTSNQTVVGLTPINDDLIFLCQIFFFNYTIHDIFSILILFIFSITGKVVPNSAEVAY